MNRRRAKQYARGSRSCAYSRSLGAQARYGTYARETSPLVTCVLYLLVSILFSFGVLAIWPESVNLMASVMDADGLRRGEPPDILPLDNSSLARARLGAGRVEANFEFKPWGRPFFASGMPELVLENDVLVSYRGGDRVVYSLSAEIQAFSKNILKEKRVPWGAIVALDAKTGRVLALASHSEVDGCRFDANQTNGMPAASLFKIVTAASSVERGGLGAKTEVYYRGGDHQLNKGNFRADKSRDSKLSTLEAAFSKSNNPVFARLALGDGANKEEILQTAFSFGFNTPIPFELPLVPSFFTQPSSDYQLARASAGYTNSTMTPLHAALIVSAVANGGKIMSPYLVDSIQSAKGKQIYSAKPMLFREAILASSAKELQRMMGLTAVSGTARSTFKKFRYKNTPVFGKTGTLSGKNPKGIYSWFAGYVEVNDSPIAFSTLLIDPGNARVSGSELARLFLERYLAE